MFVTHMEFALSVLYVTIVLGTAIKFADRGVRGAALLLSFFSPLLFIILPIIALSLISSPRLQEDPYVSLKFIQTLRKHKIRLTWVVFKITASCFPMLIGYTGSFVSRYLSENKKMSSSSETIMRFFVDRIGFDSFFAH